MKGKTKHVQWQVSYSASGRQWPILLEAEYPANTVKEFEAGLQKTAAFLMSVKLYPWLGRSPLTEAVANGKPMPERDAVQPPLIASPDCPGCNVAMMKSRHQGKDGATAYYCPQRLEDGSYCLWRGECVPNDPTPRVWQVKP